MNNTTIGSQVPSEQVNKENSGSLSTIDFDLSKGLTKNTNQDNYGRPIGLSNVSMNLLTKTSSINGLAEANNNVIDAPSVPIPMNTVPEPKPIVTDTISQVPVNVVPEVAPNITTAPVIDAVKSLAPTPILENKQDIVDNSPMPVINDVIKESIKEDVVPMVNTIVPPITDPAVVPVGDPAVVPVGDPTVVPVGDPAVVPVGDPTVVPVGDPAVVPIGDAPVKPIVDSATEQVNNVPVGVENSNQIINAPILPVIDETNNNIELPKELNNEKNDVKTDNVIPVGPMPLFENIVPEPKPIGIVLNSDQNQFNIPVDNEVKELPKVPNPSVNVIEPVTEPLEDSKKDIIKEQTIAPTDNIIVNQDDKDKSVKIMENLDKLKSLSEQIKVIGAEIDSVVSETREYISTYNTSLNNSSVSLEPLDTIAKAVDEGLNKLDSISPTNVNSATIVPEPVIEQPTMVM